MNWVPIYFWAFLLAYGLSMYALAPRARSVGAFFYATSESGAPASGFALTSSIFISWIFAKSVTNAANLGAQYGFVGGLAYACYWLSIPVAGFAIYRLRRRYGAGSLVQYLAQRYGRAAALAFSLAVLIRLYNEIWSNTAVVAGYFGPPGEAHYLAAAGAFTLVTLAYSLKGGLRSSLATDIVQSFLFGGLLLLMLALVLPESRGLPALLGSGHFALDAGLDLLLVALLQVLSYPFQDPVLTDRGFLTQEKAMRRSFMVSGALGFCGILAFSLIGIHAHLEGLTTDGDAPAAVAGEIGLALLLPTCLIMIISAGSTLDSAFSALARYFVLEIEWLKHRAAQARLRIGAAVMIVFAVIGNLPLIGGADILKATTLSGTMLMGLGPVFLLPGIGRSALSFHLSFWSGLAVGLLVAMKLWPQSLAIGSGEHAALLGANLYGLALCTAGYLAPSAFSGLFTLKKP